MGEINWMTVIVSIVLSTITAIMIVRQLFYKFVEELERADEHFIGEIKQIKLETIRAIKNIKL